MTGTIGALASWLATAFVTLDQRAAQDRLEWGQLALEGLTAAKRMERMADLRPSQMRIAIKCNSR